MKKGVFPPITLEAGRARWTLRDQLARLVTLSRSIGYGTDCSLADQAELAEERALFDELATALDAGSEGGSAVAVGQIAILTRERDEARDALQVTKETLAVMNRAFASMQRQRNELEAALQEARAAARDYLPHVKYSYDDLNRGKRYERAERERLPWLGPPETPLEEC